MVGYGTFQRKKKVGKSKLEEILLLLVGFCLLRGLLLSVCLLNEGNRADVDIHMQT